jgi:hypothetical protein
VVKVLCLFLSQGENPSGSFGEFLKSASHLSSLLLFADLIIRQAQ